MVVNLNNENTPFEIVHPALYVALVHLITEETNWQAIIDRFKQLKISRIDVASIPTQKSKRKSKTTKFAPLCIKKRKHQMLKR